MEKLITYCGQKAKVACDERCNKAWGINQRPKVSLSEDVDDYAYLMDLELGIAPVNPGTTEGEHAKPTNNFEKMNKWCVRQCERSVMSEDGEWNEPLVLPDFSKRIYNKPSKHQ
jgi:hypothetical protein